MNRLLWLFLLTSCVHERLHVQSEFMTPARYASVYVGTPDPKKYCPSVGQRLLIQWRLREEFNCYSEVVLKLKMVLRNYETVEKSWILPKARGRIAYYLMDEDFDACQGVLSYQVHLFGDGALIAEVCHHLWMELIPLDLYIPERVEYTPLSSK